MNFWRGLTSIVSDLGRQWRVMWGRAAPPVDRAESDAGPTVTHDAILTLSAVWACAGLRARVLASLPCFIYERTATRRKVPAYDHPLFTLLHEAPNANMSAVEFWHMMWFSEALWGNAYAPKRTIGDRTVALEPWLPQFVTPYLHRSTRLLRYRYDDGSRQEDLAGDEVLHIKGNTLDGLVGLSPLEFGRHSFGRALATEQAAGKTMANGLMPSAKFSYPHIVKKDQRDAFRELISDYQGSANAGHPFLLENGMTMEAMSIKPIDAQLIESRAFGVEDVCRWYFTPPPLIGHTDKASSWASSLENLNRAYHAYCIGPLAVMAQGAITRSLIPPQDRRRYFAAFSLEALLRADAAGRASLYASGAQNGWLCRNEIREYEDLEDMEGGDELTVQSNLVPLKDLGKIMDPGNAAKAAILAWLQQPGTGSAPGTNTTEVQR